jgi:hypothetical protein
MQERSKRQEPKSKQEGVSMVGRDGIDRCRDVSLLHSPGSDWPQSSEARRQPPTLAGIETRDRKLETAGDGWRRLKTD